jgi:hypothetical protein
MTNYSLSTILLPAVVISSAVFSTLTVPIALIKSEPVAIEVPPFFSGEIQPIFNGEHKDIAIPYIGFAIVVSVGTGIAVVEISRRWKAYREAANPSESLPNLEQNLENNEAVERPDYRPEVSAMDIPLKEEGLLIQTLNISNVEIDAQPFAGSTAEQVVDAIPLFGSQLNLPVQDLAISTVSDQLKLSQAPPENASELRSSSPIVFGTNELDLTLSKIIDKCKHYQTCRIKVPHLKRRLFAILINDQYYSFFRVEKTKDKVLEIMVKLGHRVEKMAITQTVKGYVIWNLEPQASSCG